MKSSNLESQFKKTLEKIKIPKSKRIIFAVSGGKDSATTAYLLKKFGYKIEGFHIDLKIGDYSERCRNAVEELCKNLKIKIHVYDMKKETGSGMCYLRSAVQSKKKLKNCAVCGVIKKWILNKEARKLKADYIATGHNADDEAQTFLMNILKGSPQLSANTGIITKNISDKKLIPRIKPLFYIPEEEVRKYSKEKKLPVVYDKCPCALDSYRIQVREFLNTLSERERQNILKNFKRIGRNMIKENQNINYCEICGEPARRNLCKRCELVKN